ncbi:hypothetical protein GE061_019668 [Apolygus lucorum]|uniref:Uncharacterized protein n=1 Tax=Apolygus lucorum TaxID=248454 RepID=A0A6A4JQN0_APOLU|nr:hypothetical protein GE061_019668 [Apolygus lucorum]
MMESLGRSSQLLLLAALVVKATSRIPCAAHQNVDGVGGGTNQPNVITQSVTWSASKKGQKPTAGIEGDCPTDEIVLESLPSTKSMKLVSSNQRSPRIQYSDPEDDLEFKLKRLVRMLDNMQRREEKCEWGTCSRPRKTWRKNYWKKKDEEFEDEDYPVREAESMVEYSDEEEERVVRRNKKPRYHRTYDTEDVEDSESPKRVKMVPKMDWLVLKKCPKRYPKRWMRDDSERDRDSQEAGSPRDILYLPQSEQREKSRRRIVSDYS